MEEEIIFSKQTENKSVKLKILQKSDAVDFFSIILENRFQLLNFKIQRKVLSEWIPDLNEVNTLESVENFIFYSEMSFEKHKTNLKAGSTLVTKFTGIYYENELCGCIAMNVCDMENSRCGLFSSFFLLEKNLDIGLFQSFKEGELWQLP
jgi:hypothetical protein